MAGEFKIVEGMLCPQCHTSMVQYGRLIFCPKCEPPDRRNKRRFFMFSPPPVHNLPKKTQARLL